MLMSIAAGMPGAIAVRSCGAKRAAVYQRRRPERTAAYQVVGVEFGGVAGAAAGG